MPNRHKDTNGDAKLIAEFLRAIEGAPVLEVASETGLDVPTVMGLRRGFNGDLRVTTRERISSYLLRRSLPAPVSMPSKAELIWSDSAPTPVSSPARLGNIDGHGVAEIATRSGAELLVFGVFFPNGRKPETQLPSVTRFRGLLVDGGRSAEFEAPVRIEMVGSPRASDAPIYFGGRVKV